MVLRALECFPNALWYLDKKTFFEAIKHVSVYCFLFFPLLTYLFTPLPAMAPHSSTLAWKILWMEEPGGRQSMGSRLSNVTFTFHFHALEKEMAIHSSVLAWRILGKGEPGGLPFMGLHRVGHNWSELAATIFTPVLPRLHSHIETHLIFSLTLTLHRTHSQLFHTARSFS